LFYLPLQGANWPIDFFIPGRRPGFVDLPFQGDFIMFVLFISGR
jgi:hypothetical protein